MELLALLVGLGIAMLLMPPSAAPSSPGAPAVPSGGGDDGGWLPEIKLGAPGSTFTDMATSFVAAVKSSGLINPVPSGGRMGGYRGDSGLDILAPPGTPVVAAGSGTIVYSERGHTPWVNGRDTPNSILIELDQPFVHKGVSYPYIWYTHMRDLFYNVPSGGTGQRIEQGTPLGTVGYGNQVPHLHFGVVQDLPQNVFIDPFELGNIFGY